MYAYVDASEVHQLADDIRRQADETPTKASLVMKKTGFDMLGTVQATVPVDTGYLKSTESIDFDDDEMGFELGPTAEYGGYVEEGTSRMSAEPSLGPAFDQHLPAAERGLADVGAQVFDRA